MPYYSVMGAKVLYLLLVTLLSVFSPVSTQAGLLVKFNEVGFF